MCFTWHSGRVQEEGKTPVFSRKGHKPMPIHILCSRTKFSDYVAKILDESLDKPLHSLVHKFTTSTGIIAIGGLNKESYSNLSYI